MSELDVLNWMGAIQSVEREKMLVPNDMNGNAGKCWLNYQLNVYLMAKENYSKKKKIDYTCDIFITMDRRSQARKQASSHMCSGVINGNTSSANRFWKKWIYEQLDQQGEVIYDQQKH